MKISLKWLNEYIDISDFLNSPEKLESTLTLKGLEVESIENKAKTFQNVVIGSILEKGQHPNADRLTLCQVTTGGGKVHQIVCGAKNHKQGDRVVVALPGAVLPGNFEIKLSKIRNVESQGMLCSEKELGLSQESEGILILPEDVPIGQSFAEYKGLDDVIFELKVTPNRADCLSHYGLAREISCIFDRPLKTKFDVNLKTTGHSTKTKISLEILNSELCPRYTGRYIENIVVKPSPDWLKRRLESIGLKSINNIVDITNFVMMEMGQPLHAFDYELIAGKKIIVSQAKPGEKFTTLDSTELTLNGTELMIRDGEKAVALAGIVGGLNSGIRNETKNVFIESAYFTTETVRKTSRLHGVNTESGYRFSRGVDPHMTMTAVNRCCQLILELAGGTLFTEPHDTNPNPVRPKDITMKTSDISERLGFEVKVADVDMWMKRLGADVQKNGEQFRVQPPTYRSDLLIKEDLVEEFARLHGYEYIPEKLPQVGMTPQPHALAYNLTSKLSRIVRAQGLSEAFNYAFVDEKGHNKFLQDHNNLKSFGFDLKSVPVKIKNPLSEELNIMRQTLSYGLFKNCLHNLRHNLHLGRIFETGFVFDKEGGDYRQIQSLGILAWGIPQGLWQKESRSEELFFEVKSAIENILKNMAIKSWQWESGQELNFLHSGQSARLKVEGRTLGYLGKIHPVILEEEKVRVPVVAAEINLDTLFQGQPRIQKIKPFSKNQSVERDLAFIMPETLQVASVMSEIQKTAGSILRNISVFDVYQDQNLKKEEKRSIAFRMIYQDTEKTFTDQELIDLDQRLIQAVNQKFNIGMR